MGWKVFSRTLHSVLAIVGFVMQAFGIYSDIVQTGTTPTGPFGLSILVWGIILFDAFAISIIVQLWWRLRKIEVSYQYALSFDGLNLNVGGGSLAITLNHSNTLDKPIEYVVNIDETDIEVGGNRSVSPHYDAYRTVIPSNKSCSFQLAGVAEPKNYPCTGLIRYKILYGSPNKLMFQQIRELNLTLAKPDKSVTLRWSIRKQEDSRLRNKTLIRKVLRFGNRHTTTYSIL